MLFSRQVTDCRRASATHVVVSAPWPQMTLSAPNRHVALKYHQQAFRACLATKLSLDPMLGCSLRYWVTTQQACGRERIRPPLRNSVQRTRGVRGRSRLYQLPQTGAFGRLQLAALGHVQNLINFGSVFCRKPIFGETGITTKQPYVRERQTGKPPRAFGRRDDAACHVQSGVGRT